MQRNLRLVEFLLYLHDAVRLRRVLVLDNVLLELRKRDALLWGVCERGARVLREELVDDLGEELVRHEGRVFVVRDDEASHAFAAAIGVEGVCWFFHVSFADRILVKRRIGDGPCSSTSCRCPGRVRSATVLAKSVMNSPTLAFSELLAIQTRGCFRHILRPCESRVAAKIRLGA